LFKRSAILHNKYMNVPLSVLGLLVVLFAPLVSAQDLTPRAYWPAPKGTRVASIGYVHVSGDTIPDPSLPITGVDSSINTLKLGFLETVDLWGRTANIIFDLPYSDGDTVGTRDDNVNLKRDYQGLGDVSATVSVNLLGAPSMTKPEFAQLRAEPKLIVGAILKLVAPTGRYDSQRAINVGSNRWATRAELGLVAPISRRWLLEAALGGWFFADNSDFLGVTREQNPIAAVQVHLVHRFKPGFWASLDSSFYRGGRSTIGGKRLDDLQRDGKLGLTLVFPVARKHVIKASYSTGSIIDSDESFNTFLLGYSHIF
jgi:Putative MetA-pathway of phenol degradation